MNWAGGAAGIKSIVITLSFLFLFIVAVLLDLQYLYLMAVTLGILPIASYALAFFFAARFRAERHHPLTVTEGRRFETVLELTAEGGLPQPTVRVNETVPAHLNVIGAEPNARPFVTPDDWDGQTGHLSRSLVADKRGVYHFGAARLETSDPLGLFTFSASLPLGSEIVVHPEPIPARDTAVGGEGQYGTRERDGKTRRGEGTDFHGVRDYRPGDPLRRVHWRTTARTGRLAVVEWERAYQQDILIALDVGAGTDYGTGRDTCFEYLVKIAATLAARTLVAGGGVTLVTQKARVEVKPREGDTKAAQFRLFDALARAEPTAENSLVDTLRAEPRRDGAYFALLTARGDPSVTAYLADRVAHGDGVRVYFVDPQGFGGPTVASPAVPDSDLRVITREQSPWEHGGRKLEYFLRE